MQNEQTRDIQLAYLIISATPDGPGGTQDRNEDQRQSFPNFEICPCVPSSIIYRPQSHPSLLRAILRPAYLEILRSLTLSASVSQGHVSSTKNILCQPWSNLSRMTRSGHDLSWDQPTTRGLESFQITVHFNCTQALSLSSRF
jgi:hypothetical protein